MITCGRDAKCQGEHDGKNAARSSIMSRKGRGPNLWTETENVSAQGQGGRHIQVESRAHAELETIVV
jgi:hypothetical protein